MHSGATERGRVAELPEGAALVLDALVQPALALDDWGVVRYANSAARERFGAEAGAHCHELLRGSAASCEDCPLSEVLAEHRPRTCQFERDGFRFGLRLTAFDAGLALGTLAAAGSIERLPGEGQDLLQAILDASSDVIVATNIDRQVEFVNRTLVERTGVPAAALIGRGHRQVWPPIPGMSWDELNERVYQRGETVRLLDQRYEGSLGGGTVWVDFTFSPRRDASGAIVGAVTTARYLTKERVLELKLAEFERRFQRLFEQAPVGIAIIGSDRQIQLINPALQQILGTEEDVTGRRFETLIAEEDRERMLEAFTRVTTMGVRLAEGNQFAVVRRDGQRREVHVRTAEVEYRGERGLQAVLVDVTDLKRLQERLAEAEKLAVLGTLAAGVTHEFNNLLAAIQGRAELIGEATAPSSRAHVSARAIVRHCGRGTELIDAIAGLAAAKSPRRMAMRWEDVVDEALEGFAPRLEDEHIVVERSYEATRGIFADPGQAHQLVLNLLQNARDALQPDGGTIRVATRDHDGEVVLEIVDTGTGIDEAARGRVFEPFFTTRNRAERRSGLAVGLGLAIVNGIVRAHDGHIEVASEVGRGSRFSVSFAAHEGGPAGGAGSGEAQLPSAAALRVMVIDDDPDVTDMIELALRTRGCTVHTVNQPRRTLEACTGLELDVLIVDLVMPDMDGLQVLAELRAHGILTPAVLLSGRRWRSEDEAVMERLGVRRRLEKPVGLDMLYEAVDAAAGLTP